MQAVSHHLSSTGLRCFEFVLEALGANVGRAVAASPELARRLHASFVRMSGCYRNIHDRRGPDFSDGVTRAAYVYTYTPSQAHWVYRALSSCRPMSQLLHRNGVHVAALGGGPGTDVVGFVKWLAEQGHAMPFTCEVIDRCTAWETQWQWLQAALVRGGHMTPEQARVTYVAHDFGDRRADGALSRVSDADVVLASFLLSELAHMGARMEHVVARVFAHTKPGAYLVFNDNLTDGSLRRLDALAGRHGLEVLYGHTSQTNVHPDPDVEPAVRAYRARLGWSPKMKGRLGTRIYHRPSSDVPSAEAS
jgi:hypothetical protein